METVLDFIQTAERADGIKRSSMLMMIPRPWAHIWSEMIPWKLAGFDPP
jgi:hypothetical protein